MKHKEVPFFSNMGNQWILGFLRLPAFLFLFFLTTAALHASPWGKDADLCEIKKIKQKQTCQTPILGQAGEALIAFHQEVISPADGPRSHYIPSSSQYTLDAMRKYGFFKGFSLGCDRLMRENSELWVYRTVVTDQKQLMKWDPVK